MSSVPPPVPPRSPIPPPPRVADLAPGRSGDDPVSVIIPYKNPKALISYYTGIFALVPLIGIALAMASIVYGYQGLKFRKEHPGAHGTAHAWVGILVSAFSLLYNIPLLILFVFGIIVTITGTMD